jgi:hypothetical protein
MSSPNKSTRKAKTSAKKPPAKKAAAKKTASKSKAASKRGADGLTGADKAHFVKAMWEGLSDKNGKSTKGKTTKTAAKKAEKAPKVEILRRIPAVKVQQGPQNANSKQALALAQALEKSFGSGDLNALSPEAVQALMAIACKIYSANQETGNKYPILANRTVVTGTDVMIACGALLKAVDLQVFELGMWQSWSGV